MKNKLSNIKQITRAGYEYQDLIGIRELLRFYRDKNLYDCITLEFPNKDEFAALDDVVCKIKDQDKYKLIQVKFSVDGETYYCDWKWLISKKETGKSLIQKWSKTILEKLSNNQLLEAKIVTNKMPSAEIKNILNMARNKVYRTANFAMVEAYWNIGKSIIEEQGGNEKAEYGTGLLKELSKQMTQDFGKGFTVTNLKYMRQFYLMFPNGHALRDELSWTHYRLLIKVENDNAREFYMQEAVKSQWSTRQLERQINSFFYERLLSSKNKEQVATEIQTLELAKKPEDVIRDPYVLEFLGLTPNDDFYESDLEQALISHLQKFLLELGRGFSFAARQKRITFDGRHFRIDLVFYNYILKCFILLDLKVGDLTHQDLGQMQMYVHYYERELMNEGDNPPIGIVLCADKSESVVKYTLPENETQIFASKYKLYLPSEEELLRELNQEYQALEAGKMGKENIGGMKEE